MAYCPNSSSLLDSRQKHAGMTGFYFYHSQE
ncbi:MAG: hypothetical protein ACI9MF_001984, partial [Gammaproteobacteria bacterium]